MPTLQARLRLDKLLEGQIQFVSLRLLEPSLNLVRRSDGQWNVVELMQRLSAPRRALLSLFPSFEVSDGRVDFKFGTRKTTLYISESDLSIYPERSGKVYIRFSGSPARTDRAGMGFGHFRANVNWFLNASSAGGNQIQAELNLDPSNLSELTTLVEGHDIGVHGTISSSLWLEGPPTGLKVAGELRLNDVHRWDLLPSSGEDWAVHFNGGLDLPAHQFEVRTVPSSKGRPAPVTMHLRVSNFLARPASSVVAELKDAPLRNVLPLAERMGVPVPAGVDIRGVLNGAIGYSSETGWAGGLTVNDAEAALQGAPTLRAPSANVTLAGNRVHFDPAIIDAGGGGTLMLAGDYSFSEQQTKASFGLTNVPVSGVKSLTRLWFGGLDALSAMQDGDLTGQLSYTHSETALAVGTPAPPLWSGDLELQDGTISIPGLVVPLERARGRVAFNNSNFELTHLTASLRERTVHATYRFNLLAKHTEHARIEFSAVELAELETVLSSANRKQNLWDRLRFFRRTYPVWLSTRDLDGDLAVDHLLAKGQSLGSLKAHFLWQAATVSLTGIDLRLAHGRVVAEGGINLASNVPQWQFSARASDYPWSGGSLDAEGEFSSTGAGSEILRNLIAGGSFTGRNLALSDSDNFERASGLFRFSFADGWPDLRLSNIQASEDGDQWSGEGGTQSDGKLLVDLTHGDRQIHLVSSLAGAMDADPVSVLPKRAPQATALFRKLKLR